MGKQLRSRRAHRHHLELVSSEEEWPDDLFPLLQLARDGMLDHESPSPTPEVLAFLEEPAHGKVDADGMLLRSLEVEPIELAPLEPERRRTPRRALVAVGGAAAAIALVVLGLRPTFTGPKTTITSARTSVPVEEPAASSTVPPPTEPDASTVPETAVVPVPDVVLPPEVTAPVASAPDTTVAAATTVAVPPTSTKATSPTKSKGKTSGTKAPATTAPAPPAPSASDIVLAYYAAANTRGKCVAHQPSRATQDQVVAACGAAPVPPANLLQYWAARDAWGACAEPFFQRGWAASRVASACGPEPQRSSFGVPPNPYSKSQG